MLGAQPASTPRRLRRRGPGAVGTAIRAPHWPEAWRRRGCHGRSQGDHLASVPAARLGPGLTGITAVVPVSSRQTGAPFRVADSHLLGADRDGHCLGEPPGACRLALYWEPGNNSYHSGAKDCVVPSGDLCPFTTPLGNQRGPAHPASEETSPMPRVASYPVTARIRTRESAPGPRSPT